MFEGRTEQEARVRVCCGSRALLANGNQQVLCVASDCMAWRLTGEAGGRGICGLVAAGFSIKKEIL
jgi:hypothetical protein